MADSDTTRRVLGLDLGTNSVGWAMLECDGDRPAALLGAGSRIFEAGMEGEIDKGKEVSRNKKRRDMRLQRRQAERRARREARVARTLQAMGLLGGGDLRNGADRHQFFEALERRLLGPRLEALPRADTKARRHLANTFPYQLRAEALARPLDREELGRALYHLAQRRGFLSNRKDIGKEDEEEKSKVKGGISELQEAMTRAGCATLGQYLAAQDPADPMNRRIRERYTARAMYLEEFERIWEAQAPHHPDALTDANKQALHKAMFFQRPLRSARELIGVCTFECRARNMPKDLKRAPWALEKTQRFRLLQAVNNLWVEDTSAPMGERRDLTPDERATLIALLDREGDQTFAALRKALGLKKHWKFSLERGGEKRLIGNRTGAKLRAVFGAAWDRLSEADRAQVVEDLRSFEKRDALAARGVRRWGLTPEAAEAFADIALEPDYCAVSRLAIDKLLPHLEAGTRYATAVKAVYGEDVAEDSDDDAADDAWVRLVPDFLPPIDEAPLGELRNPTVYRTLTEMRKVVNAAIHRFGKPDVIRIELGRDIKRSKKQRKQLQDTMRDREKERAGARKKILDETGIPNPSRDDVDKALLHAECGGQCPYTGKSIGFKAMFGADARFEVEHIIPFSRCLDDSFMNKTLCCAEFNRWKGNLTPHEAFTKLDDPGDYERALERVRRFNGPAAREKYRRFQLAGEALDDFIEGFTSSQLNDTRHASRLAATYCRLLYPANDRRLHVQVGKGGITGELRAAWRLNRILGDGSHDKRADHRHHAIDAIAIALASPAMVKIVSEAAQQAVKSGHRRWWKLMQPPWEGFLDDVAPVVDRIVVSHAPKRKVKGALHKETIYSPQRFDENGKPYVIQRKAIDSLSPADVDAIVDPSVARIVRARLAELGTNNPKDAFQTIGQHPFLTAKDGTRIPIHKVRVRVSKTVFNVGSGHRARAVQPASNHHMEILRVTDKRGREKWEDIIVDQFEAWQRRKAKTPVVQRDHGPGKEFLFSLSEGDLICFTNSPNEPGVFVVRGVTKDRVAYVRHNDARLKKDIVADTGSFARRVVNSLREVGCRKVVVTPLGEVRWSHE